MILKGYSIELGTEDNFTHTFGSLPEELCKCMCDFIDNGPRYSNSSRYNYFTEKVKNHKGFSFGTAKAAVQVSISKMVKQEKRNEFDTQISAPKYLIITKL